MTAPPERPDAPPPTETDRQEAGKDYAPTPFDGPYFVPVLLAGMALWFAYDGFLNPERLDPEASLSRYLGFNQWGSLVLAIAAAFTGWRAWRGEQAKKAGGDAPDA